MLLSNRINNLSEEDKLLWYIEGLKGRVRYEVNAKNPLTLDEAMIIATNFENLTSENPHEINSFKMEKRRSLKDEFFLLKKIKNTEITSRYI